MERTTMPSSPQAPRDDFFWLGEINKASTVMLVERNLLTPAEGAHIARTVGTVIESADGETRSWNYLDMERRMIALGGYEVTKVHIGRSRVDLGRTMRRLTQRDQVLRTFEALLDAQTALLDFADTAPHAVLPGYTLGVMAQPTTLGHYLSGYVEVLQRASVRLRAAFTTVNRCPLGSGALATSSVPIERVRLAELLGFSEPIVNSIDAVQFAPVDTGAELASNASSIALSVGQLLSDLGAQYRSARPWFTITEGALTGISSMMPQKRNPDALNELRIKASSILGKVSTYMFLAHNIPHGMLDHSGPEPEEALAVADELLRGLAVMFRNLKFNENNALNEVRSDYAVTTRLAEVLQDKHRVPWRVAHHFVSELVNFGRGHELRPLEIPYERAKQLYAEIMDTTGGGPAELPIGEDSFREALEPAAMVRAMRGLGGPLPAEVDRMIDAMRRQWSQNRQWRLARIADLDAAAEALQQAFSRVQDAA